MKSRFVTSYVLGSAMVLDTENHYAGIKKIDSSWYVSQGNKLVGRVDEIYSSQEISSMLVGDGISESFEMLGYFSDNDPERFTFKSKNVESVIQYNSNSGQFVLGYKTSDGKDHDIIRSNNINYIISSVLRIQERYVEDDFVSIISTDHKTNSKIHKFITVEAAKKNKKNRKNTWDYTRNMLRVRSSNIWAYSMNIPEDSDTGDLFVQFKGRNGGPGDIYQYFDVPVRLWSKFVGTSSKGHFFWKNIRNNFLYRKLTGDRKGKLPNATM